MELSELKKVILSLVRSHPNKRVTLIELKNDLKRIVNIDLNESAKKAYFNNALSLILSFKDVLRVELNGAFSQIEAIPNMDEMVNPLIRYTK